MKLLQSEEFERNVGGENPMEETMEIKSDKRMIRYPMISYALLSDQEAAGIWAYLEM